VSIRGAFVGAPNPAAIKVQLDAAKAAFLAALVERNNLVI
jgi:hypothetical protein